MVRLREQQELETDEQVGPRMANLSRSIDQHAEKRAALAGRLEVVWYMYGSKRPGGWYKMAPSPRRIGPRPRGIAPGCRFLDALKRTKTH